METLIVSALQKVFSDQTEPPAERNVLRLFAGERGSFMLCVRTDKDDELTVSFASPLAAAAYRVDEIYAGLPIYDDAPRCTLLRSEPGFYPDLLSPFDGKLKTKAGKFACVWFEVDAADAPAGEYTVHVGVSGASGKQEKQVRVTVGKTALPPQKLVHTDWFHSDCLAVHYKVPVFSEAYWRIVERFMKNAAEHGVNCILTPLFTPALDTAVGWERPTVQLLDITESDGKYTFDFTRLTRWIDLAHKCGIDHFEFSHLFTQWGALAAPKVMAKTPGGTRRIFGWETDSLSPVYHSFLRQLGAALTAYTDTLGITDNCFIHCSDEPGADQIERYRTCAALVHEAFPKYRHIDALSDPEYYDEGLVPVPVPSENSIERFVGRVPALWTYYCCGQFRDEMPNRFFAMPSIRNRILGVLLYKYNCVGFLHWGYNFYFSQLSKRVLDPFSQTDGMHAFPSGDAFCVYPGKNGEPLSSLRQKVFYDGFQDLRALDAAEAKLGRSAVLELIRDTLGEIDFAHYPMDEETFFRFRDRLFAATEAER